MRETIDLVFGVNGQTIVCDAPEGAPTAITAVSLYRWSDGDERPLAAIDSFELEKWADSDGNPISASVQVMEVSGASRNDATLIYIDNVTGPEVGRTYLIQSGDGRREWFTCVDIDDGVLVARHPLHNDYSVGAVVSSPRMIATINDAWAADPNNLVSTSGANPMYRASWTYEVNGLTSVVDTYVNLTRYTGKHGVLPQDIEAMAPGWLERMPIDHRADQGKRLIEEAYRAVKLDLAQIDIDDSKVAEAEIVDELTRLKAIQLAEWARYLASGAINESRHLAAEKYYQRRLDSFARIQTKVPIRDSSGAARPVAPPRLTRR